MNISFSLENIVRFPVSAASFNLSGLDSRIQCVAIALFSILSLAIAYSLGLQKKWSIPINCSNEEAHLLKEPVQEERPDGSLYIAGGNVSKTCGIVGCGMELPPENEAKLPTKIGLFKNGELIFGSKREESISEGAKKTTCMNGYFDNGYFDKDSFIGEIVIVREFEFIRAEGEFEKGVINGEGFIQTQKELWKGIFKNGNLEGENGLYRKKLEHNQFAFFSVEGTFKEGYLKGGEIRLEGSNGEAISEIFVDLSESSCLKGITQNLTLVFEHSLDGTLFNEATEPVFSICRDPCKNILDKN